MWDTFTALTYVARLLSQVHCSSADKCRPSLPCCFSISLPSRLSSLSQTSSTDHFLWHFSPRTRARYATKYDKRTLLTDIDGTSVQPVPEGLPIQAAISLPPHACHSRHPTIAIPRAHVSDTLYPPMLCGRCVAHLGRVLVRGRRLPGTHGCGSIDDARNQALWQPGRGDEDTRLGCEALRTRRRRRFHEHSASSRQRRYTRGCWGNCIATRRPPYGLRLRSYFSIYLYIQWHCRRNLSYVNQRGINLLSHCGLPPGCFALAGVPAFWVPVQRR